MIRVSLDAQPVRSSGYSQFVRLLTTSHHWRYLPTAHLRLVQALLTLCHLQRKAPIELGAGVVRCGILETIRNLVVSFCLSLFVSF
jgi:hypothetical protein